MLRNVWIAAALGVVALPAFGQAGPPPSTGTPPATGPTMRQPGNVDQPGVNNPPATAPGTRPAMPGDPVPGEGRNFMGLDTDRDGNLSEREYGSPSGTGQSFSMLDKDGDGKVSREEYERWERSRPDKDRTDAPGSRDRDPMGGMDRTKP